MSAIAKLLLCWRQLHRNSSWDYEPQLWNFRIYHLRVNYLL